MGYRALATWIAVSALAPSVAAAQDALPPPAPEGYDAEEADTVAEPARTAPPGTTRVDALGWGERPLTLRLESLGRSETTSSSCEAPCQVDVSPGRYRVAIQPRGGGPRGADGGALTLREGRTAIQMTYDHRIGERSLGWTFLSIAISVVISITPLQNDILLAVIGAPIAVAFTIPALSLIFLEDSARVETAPLPPPGGGVAIP